MSILGPILEVKGVEHISYKDEFYECPEDKKSGMGYISFFFIPVSALFYPA